MLLLGLAACGGENSPSILEPISPDAARLERLWWVLLTISAGVFVVVLWLLVPAVVRRRDPPDVSERTERRNLRWVAWAGLVGPAVILGFVWVLVVLDLRALSHEGDSAGLTIEVIGKQWWWDVRYPEHDVITANEIHVPAGQPVRFLLTSADVQHSFWIPQAGPKRDMYPDRVNELVLRFDEPGTYAGVCAEFCGLQHANMQILVVAQSPADFDRWIQHQQRPAREPDTARTERGRAVFLSSSCVGCHTIRGVSSVSDFGPDLTHLADRSIVGATFALQFDLETLHTFVHEPDALKEGVLMPPAGLDSQALSALVAYLASLE